MANSAKPSLHSIINEKTLKNGSPDVQAVEKLLEAGANLEEKEKKYGYTPLTVAARYSHSPAIVEALLKGKANLKARNNYGDTILLNAARYSPSPAVVEALVKGKANVEAKTKHGYTPLTVAARYSPSPAVVEALLKGKTNLEARNNYGKTALDMAKGRWDTQKEAIIRLLQAEYKSPGAAKARAEARAKAEAEAKAAAKAKAEAKAKARAEAEAKAKAEAEQVASTKVHLGNGIWVETGSYDSDDISSFDDESSADDDVPWGTSIAQSETNTAAATMSVRDAKTDVSKPNTSVTLERIAVNVEPAKIAVEFRAEGNPDLQYFFLDLKLSGSTEDELCRIQKEFPRYFSPDVISAKQVLRLLEKGQRNR